MKSILENPYRIIGLLVGVGAREQERQIRRLKQYIDAEQEPDEDFSFPSLGNLNRTVEKVENAAAKLTLDNDKINAALFWFYKGNAITDEPAFDALKDANNEECINIWSKLIVSGEVTQRNCSAFHNLSTIYLCNAINGTALKTDLLEKAIELKIKLLESEYIKEFKSIATDDTYKTTKKELQLLFLNQIYTEVENNGSLNSQEFIKIVNKQEFIAKEDFLKEFVQKPIEQIERKIDEAKKKRKSNPSDAEISGKALFDETTSELAMLKTILSTNNIKYSSIADKIAEEILQCGIVFFKNYKEPDIDEFVVNCFNKEIVEEVNIFESFTQMVRRAKHLMDDTDKISMNLFLCAKEIAIGNITKQRCKENIENLQKWIDNKQERNKQNKIKGDLEAIINLIKDEKSIISEPDLSLLLNINDNKINESRKLINKAIIHLLNIKSVLKVNNDIYLQLSTSIVSKSQNLIIQSVNNSLNFISPLLDFNLIILKTLIKDAWEVTQIISALDMNLQFADNFNKNKQELKNICNQIGVETSNNIYKKIPQLNFIISDIQISNTDKNNVPLIVSNPMYTKYIRYLGLNIEINSFENQTVDFLLKYINPEGKYNFNSEISPAGYSQLSKVELTQGLKSIKIGGWGNSNKCTFSKGNNKIEVWLDGFMIIEKEFLIDDSPFQKIEMQLKEEELKLEKIKKTIYLESDINIAKYEMKKILEFKFFRSTKIKQKQIEEQKKIINDINNRSNDLLNSDIRKQERIIEKLKIELSETNL